MSQEWHVDGDNRAWVEAFMLVAYATKQVSNFRGDAALQVWYSITRPDSASDYRLVASVEEVGGTYAAQVFQRAGRAPLIQTPASGGSDEFRDLEVAGTVLALKEALGRNGADCAQRLEAAMRVLGATGEEFASSPSIPGANDLTWAVMGRLEEAGTIPAIG